MAESHFLSALKRRRAECLGHILRIREQIAALELEETALCRRLENVDALLRDEEPGISLESIKPRGPHPRSGSSGRDPKDKRLPVTQAVLRVLRTGGVPMTADEVMMQLSRDYAYLGEKKLMQNVRIFLSSKKKDGLLKAAANEDGILRYGIAA
jgi:hypothetical protein